MREVQIYMVNKETIEVYNEMGKNLAKLNTNRGSSSKQLKGFVAELTNTADSNVDRIQRGIGARECVIDDNGSADAVIKYMNGQTGRSIQDKCGYAFSDYKRFLVNGKYDGQILRINNDHPIFENEKQLEELNKLAKEHGVKIIQSQVSAQKNEQIANAMYFEGNIRSKLNLDNNAPLTAKFIARKKQAEYITSDVCKNVDSVITDAKDTIYKTAEKLGNEEFARINQQSQDAAVAAMSVAAITSIVDNAVQTARGEKTKEQAVKDSVKTVAETGITRYTQKTISQITENVIQKTMGEGIPKPASGKIGNDITVITVKTGQQFAKYCKSEISVDEMLENSSQILTEQIVQFAGGMLFSAIPIPGSEFIGRYIATVLYHSSIQVKMDKKDFDRYISFMQNLSIETTREIDRYREKFSEYTQEYNSNAIKQMNHAFELLYKGMSEDNVDKASQAIEVLANMIGETVNDVTEDFIFGDDGCWVGE